MQFRSGSCDGDHKVNVSDLTYKIKKFR